MDFYKKFGTYVFIIGVLLAIFSGAFEVSEEMKIIRLLLLIITGGFVGLLNIQEEEEIPFLIATGVFIIASRAIQSYVERLALFSDLGIILVNLIIFASTAAIIVALKIIFRLGSVHGEHRPVEEHEFKNPKVEEVWNAIIFIAVSLTFVLFILETFYFGDRIYAVLDYLNYIIIAIFLIDVVILFDRCKKKSGFLRDHWADVLAVIPVSGVFQLAKLLRLVKIAKIAGRTSKISKMSKISHSAKFFSHKSGFNKYLKEEEKR